MKAELRQLDGAQVGVVELDDAVFDVDARDDILQRAVRWQLARRRAGTASTKLRSEVSYSKRKIYRQKRTGGARHGARSAGIFRHGAPANGPKPRSFEISLPKRVRRLALRMALSARARTGRLVVLEDLALAEGRTRALRGSVVVPDGDGVLVVGGSELDANFLRAARNIEDLDVLPSIGANVYDILRRGRLVLTRDAVAELEKRLK